ncbi:SMP-30/gluconolactonase/LRE family protein [Nocardioides anomalus]|uniref:SMP-30/gluconolactonase/LRE family protein n=1 Tax=Nocardioides anomalus TaxID=2712223 RepID=A0A6G6WCM5_9ACTN|nr:SMP-30/gluconolactonase/LRE family protein [Nocardioides anomalus]QIG42903.1 SMP-30/gluconolactonase/LRE family protein [Nocardioides anomalus]
MSPTVLPVPGPGAEDVVVGADGAAYTGTEDGALWRVTATRVERVADTGGRPLGIELDGAGRLVVCDARRGVLRVDPATGAVEVLVDAVRDVPMAFCNNAALAADGTIWFTDSSRHYGIEDYQGDIAMATRSGRLLRRDPDGTVGTALDGLDFANGVALAADESYVAVAESGACTLVRLWLTGARAGERELLVPELPGYPDNAALGSDGLVWVAIAGPRVALATRIRRGPRWLRRVAAATPRRLQPAPAPSCRVQAYDDAGRLVHDLDLPSAHFGFVTGVREHRGRVWLSSLQEPAIAYVDL